MPPLERIHDGFLPGRHAIDAYGSGGFRFSNMSHRGSVLALPSGIRKWDVVDAAEISIESLAALDGEAADIDILLFGTGGFPARLPVDVISWLRAIGLRSDVMTSSAATMTYNVLLAENRRVAAALMAVD
jgi:uncharacterized protein